MNEQWPAYGPYDVKALRRFFDNKRRTYRLEKKKVETTKSGMASSEIYRGRWRFYNSLKFCDASKVTCWRSVSTEECQAAVETTKIPQAIDDPSGASDAVTAATDDQNTTVDDPIAAKACPATSRQGTHRKRRQSPHRLDEILAQRQNVLEKIAASVGQPASATQQEDDIDYFGKVVAANMCSVPKDKLIACQTAILNTLEIHIDKSE
ncbi:hypothetical protein HPB52_008552 [Rhipicephalus sanguineus]|uniref:MADF domain-containing protein n=1 Tax=Rhipicephalus sanguineus TaxID=34632 RepID=A0A9D4T387_RHISA|nr:hypothetical protein HPB52_008552 [Rhipicephalus sanguineus]